MTPAASRLYWFVAYLLVMVAVTVGLLQVRSTMMARLDTPQARAEWERWRQEARAQAEGEGPVQRRVPLSNEPPTLVLLRDHFAICLAGGLLFSSLLFAAMMVSLKGVFQRSQPARDGFPDREDRGDPKEPVSAGRRPPAGGPRL